MTKIIWMKRKRKNYAKYFEARGRKGLPIWLDCVEEIAYSELSTKEKVKMMLMQSAAIILENQQNLNFFGIFNHISKSR